MVDFVLLHRAALAGARSGAFGTSMPEKRITLEALPEGHVLQVLAGRATGDVTALVASLGDGKAQSVRPVGPGQWFVVGDAVLSTVDMAERKARLSGQGSMADQAHGRVRIAISGTDVEAVLAKGTAVDLNLCEFPAGRSAMTLIGHISALITRTGEHAFEILVLRGFAESLWDELIEMSLEFGVDARPPV
ncbi:sarcosine oxidase subunit gamma family protein [Pararhizobium antarcticum]|uniref:Sarcosine oxidase subunit gamma n=1 Tax=Pararhizobium antarcticum TaxID=1798805 RepID=A0A657LYJ8_9HYPH|nr:sarcosine oxidase subunit gamma family protein [Pararhizobium antarcticum]OJG00108.1 sarcosine oxidase subunit gamma [Rhizobium sp. 58]OJG01489.1 sarcosine oxidase subunit gamma [Pararhizobium antarcticum]